MTQSLNNMTAATLGTSAAAATLPPHLVRVTRIVSGITRVLPLAISLMVALAFIIPIAAAFMGEVYRADKVSRSGSEGLCVYNIKDTRVF